MSILRGIKTFLLENRTLKQTVAKNTFWLTAGTLTGRLVRAVVIIYAARILGTEGYGVFSYALSLAAFFSVFSDIGLSPLLTRESVKKPEKIAAYLSTVLLIKIFILIPTILAIAFLAPLFTKIEAARSLLTVVAFLVAFDSLRNFGFAITRAQNKMQLEAGLGVLTDLFITGLGVAALFIAPSAKTLAVSYTAGSGLGLVAVLIVLSRHLKNSLRHFDKTLIGPVLRAAWPFAVMSFLGGFLINIDTIIIGWFRTSHELGLYGAAQRPIQFLYLLPSFFAGSLFPIISKLIHNGEHSRVKNALEKSLISLFILALPLTVGGIILGSPIINLLFGVDYGDASLTFELLLITVLLVFPGMVVANTIFAYDGQKVFIISTGVGALGNIILDLLLIPSYGIAGSAVATIISQILVNGYLWYRLKQINPFVVFPHLTKIVLATIAMGVFAYLLNALGVWVIAAVIASMTAYFMFLLALREPFLKELNIWRE